MDWKTDKIGKLIYQNRRADLRERRVFSFRYTEFDWIFKCIIQSKLQGKDLTGGIVCNIIVVGVEAMNLRRITEPWASQHLMFKQGSYNGDQKGNQLFFFNG